MNFNDLTIETPHRSASKKLWIVSCVKKESECFRRSEHFLLWLMHFCTIFEWNPTSINDADHLLMWWHHQHIQCLCLISCANFCWAKKGKKNRLNFTHSRRKNEENTCNFSISKWMRIDNFRLVSTAWHLSHSHYPIWIWKRSNRREKDQHTFGLKPIALKIKVSEWVWLRFTLIRNAQQWLPRGERASENEQKSRYQFLCVVHFNFGHGIVVCECVCCHLPSWRCCLLSIIINKLQ